MVFKSLALAGPNASWTAPNITYIGVVNDRDDRVIEIPIEIRAKGTNQVFSHLALHVYSNNADGPATFTFRKNSADGNQQVTVPAGVTGFFEDALNTDSVVTGDDVSTKGDVSAATVGNLVTSMIVYTVEDDSNAVTYLQAQIYSLSVGLLDGTTRYGKPHGYWGGWAVGVSSSVVVRVNEAYTWDNLRIYIDPNQNGAGVSFYSYLFGVGRGNQAISVPGGATGRFEDIINNDVLSDGRYISIEAVASPVGGSKFTYVQTISSRLSFNGGSFLLPAGTQDSVIPPADDDWYGVGGGDSDARPDRARIQTPIRDFKLMVDRVGIWIDGDDVTEGTTLTLEDGGVSTDVTLNAKSTTYHECIGRHVFNPDTYASYRVEYGTTENQTVGWLVARGREVFDASKNLFAEFEIKSAAPSVDLAAYLKVRHKYEQGLAASFILRQRQQRDLNATFTIRHITIKDLWAVVGIAHWQRLLAYFWVRQPSWLWSSRRYVNGVVDLSEGEISDAVLEYVIEGVMVDVKSHLTKESIPYEDWNLSNVPLLLKRAVTYGAVASLFARGYLGIRDRVQPTLGPRSIILVESELLEEAMEYWENKMNRMLELYASTVFRKIISISTEDEEPVFTMEFDPQDAASVSGIYSRG